MNMAFVFNILKELPPYGFSPSTKHPSNVYILSSFDFVWKNWRVRGSDGNPISSWTMKSITHGHSLTALLTFISKPRLYQESITYCQLFSFLSDSNEENLK